MSNKPILLDGSAGTALWTMAEKNSVPKEPVWRYNIEHPEFVSELHRKYISAGSRMIQTNTFSANPMTVNPSSGYSIGQVVEAAAKLAKEAVNDTGVVPYLSAGPLLAMLEPYGILSEKDAAFAFSEIFEAAVGAGIEFIMLETFMDLRMMTIAAKEAGRLPCQVICSMTFSRGNMTLMGDSVREIVSELEALKVDGMGMNCSFGPVEAIDIIREFKEYTDYPLYFKPNTGIGENYGAEQFAREIAPALDFVTYIGGCCGTDESYIRKLAELIG